MESTAGEGESGEGASSQGEIRAEDLDSESDLDMTEVWPPVPPATREASATEPGARTGGVAKGQPPTLSVSPARANFGGTNGSSSSGSSDDNHPSSESSNNNDNGDLPALVERPARDLEVFGQLLALQSGRTRSQSRGLTMSRARTAPSQCGRTTTKANYSVTNREKTQQSRVTLTHCSSGRTV